MMVDVNASLSGSSSATAGLDQGGAFQNVFGDQIVGGKKPTPPWLQLVLGGAIALLFLIWIVRR